MFPALMVMLCQLNVFFANLAKTLIAQVNVHVSGFKIQNWLIDVLNVLTVIFYKMVFVYNRMLLQIRIATSYLKINKNA